MVLHDFSSIYQSMISRVKLSQAFTGLLAQQLCNSNVNMIEHEQPKLASSTMFKPVNNHVQAGQLNHVQAL